MTSFKRKSAIPPLILLTFLTSWEAACHIFRFPKYLIPSPTDIAKKSLELGASIPPDLLTTGMESLLGFILGSLFGIMLGILFATYRSLEVSLMPYAIALKTIPIVAIAPLFVIWFGYGMLAKVLLAALICFFPVLVSMAQGLKEIDQKSLDLFRSLAASRWQTFAWLRWPSSLTHLFASFRVAIVFSVIGAIVAEFAGAKQGVGFRILVASYNVDTAAMFVYILLSALLGMVFYTGIIVLEKLLLPWRERN